MFRLWRLKHVAAAGCCRHPDAGRLPLLATACLLLFCLATLPAPGSSSGAAPAAGQIRSHDVSLGDGNCDRHRDFYARLQGNRGQQGRCAGNTAAADSCCIHDDGICSGACDPQADNDCRILAGLIDAHEFLLGGKSAQGFTPDARDSLFKVRSEYYRLVPCMQALGYMNLYRHTGRRTYLKEAVDRLDFMASHLNVALSHLSYDGQLGWAFLNGYELTCDRRYLEIGLDLARASNPYESRVLNWGMLAALNLLEAHEVTGEGSFLSEARDIVTQTLTFQNEDGSFPHQDERGKRSLPYTSWLAHELCRYYELDPGNPQLALAIDNSAVLLARQIAADGSPAYEYDSLVVVRMPDPMCLVCSKMDVEGCSDYCSELCPSRPDLPPCWCIVNPEKECPYIDTLANVSYYDEENRAYDVRGWTSELPSTAFVLSSTGRPEAKWKVLSFLLSLQNPDGSFPDKWGFIPNPNHPTWPFSSDTHSVIRTSCVFFYLSELLKRDSPGKGNVSEYDFAVLPEAAFGEAAVPEASGADGSFTRVVAAESPGRADTNLAISARPSPSFGNVLVSFNAGSGPAEIVVLNAGGGFVKRLAGGLPGNGVVRWDGRNEDGRPAAPGVYFVALRSSGAEVSSKFVLLRSE